VGPEGLVASGIAGRKAQIELAAAGCRQGQVPLNLATPAGQIQGARGEHQPLTWVALSAELLAEAPGPVLTAKLEVVAGEGRRQQGGPPAQIAQGEGPLAASSC
jgi:hypothetical protein